VWEWESSAAAAYHVAKYPIPVGKRPTEGGHEYSDPTFGSHFFYTPGSIPQAIAAVTQKMVVLDGLEFYRYKVWNEYFED
jgi:hypothetical protein